ncbi:MAG: nadE [Alphaproteobacteria bacterium]|jgi:NAD+ synthase|nr:nadE [Alphaproteobacteria bacterium]
MSDALALALAQLNPIVGDVAGNQAKVRAARVQAAALGADLVLFTELVLSGYPPEDLVLKPAFQRALQQAAEELAADTKDGGPAMLLTTPWVEDGNLHNAVLLLEEGRIAAKRFKVDLPNYGVFDEKRVFKPGPMPGPIVFRGIRLGVPICEDIWTPDVVECLSETGAEIMLVPNGSPFEVDKDDVRLDLVRARIKESGLPFVYLNQVGGQDELLFDGGSFVVGADGEVKLAMESFKEAVTLTKWQRGNDGWICQPGEIAGPLDRCAAIYQAMMLGLRDYVNKNRFPGVVIGLSGGIDSALTAAAAADALGPERVHTVMMPSPFTGTESLEDAAACAKALAIRLDNISIGPAMEAFDAMLQPLFGNAERGVTEENIQARARGMTLMAISNKFGSMVLSTGNKSEMSVGYSTLYGDMCGGYSVLKDVYKTAVYDVSRWRNGNLPDGALGPKTVVIPERILTKAPTAELRPNQTDQDSLPPYEQLDRILHGLIERDLAVDELVTEGEDRATVQRVWRMLENAEYKRRQAPPGVKITSRALSRDRRYPITNAFRG